MHSFVILCHAVISLILPHFLMQKWGLWSKLHIQLMIWWHDLTFLECTTPLCPIWLYQLPVLNWLRFTSDGVFLHCSVVLHKHSSVNNSQSHPCCERGHILRFRCFWELEAIHAARLRWSLQWTIKVLMSCSSLWWSDVVLWDTILLENFFSGLHWGFQRSACCSHVSWEVNWLCV